jgi:general secretion pathway protein H
MRGFTLLELMIVVAIIALATSAVSLALRDGDAVALERETLRLSALLESARAQSRTSGVPVYWRSTGDGFEFIGLPTPAPDAGGTNTGRRPWLSADTRALIAQPTGAVLLQLGPEPLIAAQQVVLMQGDRRLTLGTDGLSPFAVVPAEGASP